jgi:copper chaperone CopZ
MSETTPLRLEISGMTCGHCVARVTKALAGVPGVSVKSVEVGHAEVAFDPAQADPVRIAGAVSEIGFAARPA